MEELGAGAPRGPGAGRGRREGRGQGGEDKRPLRGWRICLYLRPRLSFYFLFFMGFGEFFPSFSCCVRARCRDGRGLELDMPCRPAPKGRAGPICETRRPRKDEGPGSPPPPSIRGRTSERGEKRGVQESMGAGEWGAAYPNSLVET